MSDKWITTQAELIVHIERDWIALNKFLNKLTDAHWLNIKNEDGWTIKDHVAHLTAWEASALAILNGQSRHEVFGIEEAIYLSQDVDKINQAVYDLHREDDLNQVREQFKQGHQAMIRKIKSLSDDDLNKSYSHYLPDEVGDNDFPTINAIYGNTAHHFRTHQAWMEAMCEANEE